MPAVLAKSRVFICSILFQATIMTVKSQIGTTALLKQVNEVSN